MPIPKNPNIPEFYVYQFTVSGVPFYIGIGRAERDSDRIRFIKNIIRRRKLGLPVKHQANSVLLIEELLNRNVDIQRNRIFEGLTREEALKKEKEVIIRLVSSSVRLMNFSDNPNKEREVLGFANYLQDVYNESLKS